MSKAVWKPASKKYGVGKIILKQFSLLDTTIYQVL